MATPLLLSLIQQALWLLAMTLKTVIPFTLPCFTPKVLSMLQMEFWDHHLYI